MHLKLRWKYWKYITPVEVWKVLSNFHWTADNFLSCHWFKRLHSSNEMHEEYWILFLEQKKEKKELVMKNQKLTKTVCRISSLPSSPLSPGRTSWTSWRLREVAAVGLLAGWAERGREREWPSLLLYSLSGQVFNQLRRCVEFILSSDPEKHHQIIDQITTFPSSTLTNNTVSYFVWKF